MPHYDFPITWLLLHPHASAGLTPPEDLRNQPKSDSSVSVSEGTTAPPWQLPRLLIWLVLEPPRHPQSSSFPTRSGFRYPAKSRQRQTMSNLRLDSCYEKRPTSRFDLSDRLPNSDPRSFHPVAMFPSGVQDKKVTKTWHDFCIRRPFSFLPGKILAAANSSQNRRSSVRSVQPAHCLPRSATRACPIV